MGKLFWIIIQVGLKCIPLKREAEEITTDKNVESDVTMEAEVVVSQGMPVDTRNWKKQGTDSSLEPPRESSPASTLILAQ